MKGEIIKWFADKGYGFVKGTDDISYFVHCKQIMNGEEPDVGTMVKFTAVTTDKGEQAHNVVILDG